MLTPHHYRRCDRRFTEREARLCFETPVPDQTENRFTMTSKDWGQHIARFVTSLGGEVPAYIIEQVGRVPLGIAQGIGDMLQRDKKLDRAQEALRNLATLTANAPPAVIEWIADIFKEHPELSAEAMVKMLSYQHWIKGFDGLLLYMPSHVETLAAESKKTDNAKKVISENTEPWGPREYLETLSYLERRERFATLVASVIPDDAQKDPRFRETFSDTNPATRFDTFAKKQDMLVPAMKKIYGLQKFDFTMDAGDESMDEKLARESIRQKFFLFDADGKKLRKSDKDSGGTALLHEELKEQLRRRRGRLTVDGIRQQMEEGNPPASLILGAVNSGVVTDADIQKAVPELDKIHTERQLASNEQRRNLEEVTRASKDEMKRGAETMSQRFDKAPGWMKLLIVGGLIGGVMKFPKTSALIGAIFAGQYFLLKDDNPIDTNGNLLLNGLSFLRGRRIGPQIGNAKAVSQLGEQVLSFLPDQAHEQIDTSVTGFALLAGLDISVLATHSEASDKSGRKVILRAWDQPMRTAISTSLKTRGLDSTAANRFFPSEDPLARDEEGNPLSLDCTKNRNLCETGDALAGIFFLMGRQRIINGNHENPSLDMGTLGIIEKARTENIKTGQYDDISESLSMMHPQRNEKVNIREAYYLVMMEGKEAAEKRPVGTTLVQIMQELAAQPQKELPGVGGNSAPVGLVAGGDEVVARRTASSDGAARTAKDDGKARSTDATDSRRTSKDDAARRSTDADDSRRVDKAGGGRPRSSADAGKPFTGDSNGSRRTDDTDSTSRTSDPDGAKRTNSADEDSKRRGAGGDAGAPSSDARGIRRTTTDGDSRGNANTDSSRLNGSSDSTPKSRDADASTQRPSTESQTQNRSGNTDTKKRNGSETSSGRSANESDKRANGDHSPNARDANIDGKRSTTEPDTKNRSGNSDTQKRMGSETSSGRPSDGNGTRTNGNEETKKRNSADASAGRSSNEGDKRATDNGSSTQRGNADTNNRPAAPSESGKTRTDSSDSKRGDASQDTSRPSTDKDAEPRS